MTLTCTLALWSSTQVASWGIFQSEIRASFALVLDDGMCFLWDVCSVSLPHCFTCQESVQVDYIPFERTLDTHISDVPGLHLAEASIFVACAMNLAVFNIQKAKGPDGQPITPEVEWSSGLLRYAPTAIAGRSHI